MRARRRRTRLTTTRRLLLVIAAAAAVASLTTGCTPKPRVIIFGDSLTIEAKNSGESTFWLQDYTVDWSGTRYMTSPCNGLKTAKSLGYVPDVVVINYSGNNGSFSDNCMNFETGDALAARYRQDVQALIDRYRNGRTKIVVVGAPVRQPYLVSDNLIYDTLRALVAEPRNNVAFMDGGKDLTPDRNIPSRVATCLSFETGSRCGNSKDPKKNYIRDEKRNHLCPLGGKIDGTCKIYSSGAVRLTLNLANGIRAAKVAAR